METQSRLSALVLHILLSLVLSWFIWAMKGSVSCSVTKKMLNRVVFGNFWLATVVLKLFSLLRLWKSLLNLRRTSSKMLIKTLIIKVLYNWWKHNKNAPDILFDLYFCLNQSKALRTSRHVCLSSFYNDSFIMNATILSDTSSISLSKIKRSKLNNQQVDYFYNWLLLSSLYLSDAK